ncbi:MAG: MoaD/ThiS family protein [Verrucomicrobiales bacterium]|nr:MoaD/ThiS family protein [Verrucomicrobiales bacterium]
MEITVQYTGQLAGITGETDELIDLPEGTTLPALIGQLCEKYGEKYADLLVNSDGNLRPSTLVILDGEQADSDPSNIILDDVKTVMLMTPIAGG